MVPLFPQRVQPSWAKVVFNEPNHRQHRHPPRMLLQIAVIASSAALLALCLFVIPGPGDTSGVKGAIAFSSYTLLNVPITVNQALSILSVLQVTLFLAATSIFLSRLAWLLIKVQGAPIATLDTPNRNIGQIVKLLANRPSASVSLLSFLAIFAMLFASIENFLLQRAVRDGKDWNAGASSVRVANTSSFNSSALPVIMYSSVNIAANAAGLDPSAIAPSHFHAGYDGFGDVIAACNNVTGICDPDGKVNATAPLVNCDANLDCTQDVDVFNDFATDCSTTYSQTPVSFYATNKGSGYFSSEMNWIQSSVSKITSAQKPGTGDLSVQFVSSFSWNLTKIDPTIRQGSANNGTVVLAQTTTVLCNVSSAWSVRTEQYSKGTLLKKIKHVYGLDLNSPAPKFNNLRSLQNYTDERAESYLPVNDQGLTSAQESLHYLFVMVNAATGSCSGSSNVGDGEYRLKSFSCQNPFLQSFSASTIMSFNNSAVLLTQEMNFALERVTKRLISSTMDATVSTPCSNCTYKAICYVDMATFWCIVGLMNGLSLLFGIGSLLIVRIGRIGDFDVSAARTIFTFGGAIIPENEFKTPIVAAPRPFSSGRDGENEAKTYALLERRSTDDVGGFRTAQGARVDFGTF
ncbi:hypothetical protein BC830DRAFT_1094237 [Chytriomyces sp. MP71]|nr:hypothetical protein BC830DRAFT_1094237 [Chytriomyces sp. MP71]